MEVHQARTRTAKAARRPAAARLHHPQALAQLEGVDPAGQLVGITLYHKGANEVIRRLELAA